MATGTSDEDLILRNCVKLEHISDPLVPAEAILRRCNHMQVMFLSKTMPLQWADALVFAAHGALCCSKVQDRSRVPAKARTAVQEAQAWWYSRRASLGPHVASRLERGPNLVLHNAPSHTGSTQSSISADRNERCLRL